MTVERYDHPEAWEMGPGLLESVWKYRKLVIITVIVAGAVGFGASFLQSTMYEGEASMILADPRNSGVFRDESRIVIDPSRYVRNQAERIESTAVLARAAQLEGGRVSIEDLRERVTAEPSTNLDLITIRALDPTAGGAASLANSVGEAYQQIVSEEVQANAARAIAELDSQIAELQAQIDELDARLATDPGNSAIKAQRDAATGQLVNLSGRSDQIAVDAALYGSGVELFESAEVPESPAQPKPIRNGALAAVLGMMAASAWAWWRADKNEVMEDRNDPAPILGAPLLAEIPDFEAVGIKDPLPTANSPGSAVAEAYQFLSNSIDFALPQEGSKVILVTSPLPADGKSITAANLAVAAAGQPDREVILVDSDERVRGLSRLFNVNDKPGLTDIAAANGELTAAFFNGFAGHRGKRLKFIPAGSPAGDTASFFRSPHFRTALQALRGDSRFVILDSPPLLGVADASAMAGQVDGIVLVVNRGTPAQILEDTRLHLAFVGAPLLGYVFNRSEGKSGKYGYGKYAYKYRYGYGYASPNEVTRKNQPGKSV